MSEDAELVRLRKSNRRFTYLVVFMSGVAIAQMYAGVQSIRTIRSTNDVLDKVADQRDQFHSENAVLRQENAKLREDITDLQVDQVRAIRQGVLENLPRIVAELSDKDIARFREIHRQRMQPPPAPLVH